MIGDASTHLAIGFCFVRREKINRIATMGSASTHSHSRFRGRVAQQQRQTRKERPAGSRFVNCLGFSAEAQTLLWHIRYTINFDDMDECNTLQELFDDWESQEAETPRVILS